MKVIFFLVNLLFSMPALAQSTALSGVKIAGEKSAVFILSWDKFETPTDYNIEILDRNNIVIEKDQCPNTLFKEGNCLIKINLIENEFWGRQENILLLTIENEKPISTLFHINGSVAFAPDNILIKKDRYPKNEHSRQYNNFAYEQTLESFKNIDVHFQINPWVKNHGNRWKSKIIVTLKNTTNKTVPLVHGIIVLWSEEEEKVFAGYEGSTCFTMILWPGDECQHILFLLAERKTSKSWPILWTPHIQGETFSGQEEKYHDSYKIELGYSEQFNEKGMTYIGEYRPDPKPIAIPLGTIKIDLKSYDNHP
jgi:hypothetical protein